MPGGSVGGAQTLAPRSLLTTHFPAFAVAGYSAHRRMMEKRTTAFKNKEFPKNKIKSDKFTGFFDKLPVNYLGG